MKNHSLKQLQKQKCLPTLFEVYDGSVQFYLDFLDYLDMILHVVTWAV